MRTLLLSTLGLALVAAAPALAQQRDGTLPRVSPNATLSQTVGVTTVTVGYSRPAVRERVIFGADGALVPYGEVWRTGANEATSITFSTDVRVEGQPLAAGTYGFFTVPGPDRWTLVFNDNPAQWGAYQYDAAHDVLRVDVVPEEAPHAELFTVSADAVSDTEATFALRWAGVRVPFRVATDTDALVRAAADAAAAGATDWRVPQAYAAWAAQNERLLDAAEAWSERAVALEANYNTLSTRARLAAAREDFPTAVSTGARAVEAARAMATPPGNLGAFETLLEGWRARAGR